MTRTKLTAVGLSAAAIAALAAAGAAKVAAAATVAISCGAVGQELELCREGAEAWAEQTGNEVEVVSTPNSATERLALYQQILAAESPDIDVFQIDVIWPGILANHFIDLGEHVDEATLSQHFPSIVENNTVDGKLVALPWFTDAGLLYYRKDLLEKHSKEVPRTWQDLETTAQEIMSGEGGQLHGFVFQAKAYEGLTCNGLEWVDSFQGGTIVNDTGEVTINNPDAIEAIDTAAAWIGGIAPQGVLNYTEEEARGVFQSGNAVFMRNWPYAWALGQAEDSPIRDKIGVAPLPKGGEDGKHSGCLGGWQLAVSQYSDNAEAAIDLARFMTSYDEQKRRAVEGSFNPTIAELYQDKEVLDANPFFGELYDTFTNAVARPSKVTGEDYNRVSAEFYGAVHQVLSGRTDAETALGQLERRLQRLARGWGG